MIALLRRYLPRYRWPLLLVIVLLFVQAVGTLYLPELNAEIINNGVVTGDTDYILRTGAFMLAVSLALMVAAIVAVYYSARVAMGFGRDVRCAIFRSVESFSQADINHFGTATLITRNTNDVQQVQQVILMALTMMITAPILTIGGLIMALRQDVPLSGVLLVIIPILVVFIALVMTSGHPALRGAAAATDHINLVTRETLTGIRVIRAFVRTGHEERRFDAANRDYMGTALSLNRLFAITMPAIMLHHEPEPGGGALPGRLPRRQRRDAHRQPDRLPAVHHADPHGDHDRRAHAGHGAAGGRLRAGASRRSWTPQPSIADPASARDAPTARGHVELRGVELRLSGGRGARAARHHLRGASRARRRPSWAPPAAARRRS